MKRSAYPKQRVYAFISGKLLNEIKDLKEDLEKQVVMEIKMSPFLAKIIELGVKEYKRKRREERNALFSS